MRLKADIGQVRKIFRLLTTFMKDAQAENEGKEMKL